ncbi:MAG: FlgT C-terminal domain-containing protein [Methanobacteriaceae archaeon]|jgi:hypothetical protein|nr:FlgT C-terminal domain-containing protein [Methanobacteriaceae archaeon]MDP2837032.1 FlgT C-terminal domain-containing protein [Methanobacteriaceae archaeon]MDP3034796.1 FlgT C-terminal domain-containing protein [Methanobacteriaceae archaeon]MDP3484576.1 FlgT C-terminal domain-containing protein [Methanobacteriaceae archaeon]MDP3624419.1 FlgT C-terminal domain-containing protein [Methanobacteriaceae archaeon]
MSNTKKEPSIPIFPATVVEIEDEYRLAINRGAKHGIKLGQRFSIYGTSDNDIIDPETGENLGKLEIFRGSGKVVNVQETMSTIESTEKKAARKEIIHEKSPFFVTSPIIQSTLKTPSKKIVEFPEEQLPFNYAQVLDKAKPI